MNKCQRRLRKFEEVLRKAIEDLLLDLGTLIDVQNSLVLVEFSVLDDYVFAVANFQGFRELQSD